MGLTKCKSSVSLCISENEEAEFDDNGVMVSDPSMPQPSCQQQLSPKSVVGGGSGMHRSRSTGVLSSLHSITKGMKKSVSGLSLASLAKTVTESESSSLTGDKPFFPLGGCLKIKTQRESVRVSWDENRMKQRQRQPSSGGGFMGMPEQEEWGDAEFLFMDDDDDVPPPPASKPDDDSTRRISFSTISIHSHPRILGDNPAVKEGYPLSIGWKAISSEELSLDDYETSRDGPPRPKADLMVPKDVRKEWLREEGVTRWQFSCAKRDIEFIQKCRELEKSKGKKVSVKRNIPKS